MAKISYDYIITKLIILYILIQTGSSLEADIFYMWNTSSLFVVAKCRDVLNRKCSMAEVFLSDAERIFILHGIQVSIYGT